MRLQAMENLGKRAAILAASRVIRHIYHQNEQPVRILELGCGEGQVVGTLADGHAQLCSSQGVIGVDYNPQSLARCRRDFPGLQFVEGDFTDPALLAGLGQYDLVLLVNALHEVYSATYSQDLGEVDVPAAKQRTESALGGAVRLLKPGGWLVLFDGVEPSGDLHEIIQIRFLDNRARNNFETFARQYRPFRITFRETGERLHISLSRRDFTRYITKSIFLEKQLWQTERLESYQYFSEEEFRVVFARLGLKIEDLYTFTENGEKWRRWVAIEQPGADFPQEHILIQARL